MSKATCSARTLLIAGALLSAKMAFAFGAPEHSAVVIDAKDQGTEKQFTVKITAKEGMAVNFEAPWKLEVKDHDGLALAKTSFVKADMDEKLPGFVVQGKTEKPSGSFDYNLTAFVCTKDKTQCFREVHKGKQDWTAAK